jgi:hypothetical protein
MWGLEILLLVAIDICGVVAGHALSWRWHAQSA